MTDENAEADGLQLVAVWATAGEATHVSNHARSLDRRLGELSQQPSRREWTVAVVLRRACAADYEKRSGLARLFWLANESMNGYVHADLLVWVPCRGGPSCEYWTPFDDHGDDDDDDDEADAAARAATEQGQSTTDGANAEHDPVRGHVLCATFTNSHYTYTIDRVFASFERDGPVKFRERCDMYDVFAVSDSLEVAEKAHACCQAQQASRYNPDVVCAPISQFVVRMCPTEAPQIPDKAIRQASAMYDHDRAHLGQAMCRIVGHQFYCSEFVMFVLKFAMPRRYTGSGNEDATGATTRSLHDAIARRHAKKIPLSGVCCTD